MDEILYKLNKIRYYKISKCNDLKFTEPEYEIKYNKTYDGVIPDWVDINKGLLTNSFIIDKNIQEKRYMLKKDKNSRYIDYDIDNSNIKNKNKNIFNRVLRVGSLKRTYEKRINNNTFEVIVNYDHLDLINTDNFNRIFVQQITPIGIKFKDNRIEQKRLRINIDKLKVLDYLINDGDFSCTLTHATIDATKEIIIILSYLFDETVLIRQILYDMTSSGFLVSCNNFKKDKYNQIKDKLNISRFEELGNIENISKLGIESFNKETLINEITNFSNIHNEIIFESLKIFTTNSDETLKIISKIAYSQNVPIKPQYLDDIYINYKSFYNLCSENNVIYVFNSFKDNILQKILNIYFYNLNYGISHFEDIGFSNYDLYIIYKENEILDSINRIHINGLIYLGNNELINNELINNYVYNKILIRIDDNIYQKINHIVPKDKSRIKLKNLNYEVNIYNNKDYNDDLIKDLIPFVKNNQVKPNIYSISIKTANLQEDTYEIYPYYPILDKDKIYLNPIHIQMINKDNFMNLIKEHIKVIISGSILNTDQLLIPDIIKKDTLKIIVNNKEIPYLDNSYEKLSYDTKSVIYTISKLYTLNIIFEIGTWYGGSSRFIKKYNIESKLICLNEFEGIFEKNNNIVNEGINKFYIKYPHLETVYKKMQKYKNVEIIKGNILNGYNYLIDKKIIPDMIFINYINDSKLLFNLLYHIFNNHSDAIVMGNHYLIQHIKDGVLKFLKTMNKYYKLIENKNCYILIPISRLTDNILKFIEERNTYYNNKLNNNLYYQCYLLIKDIQIKPAINFIIDKKLDLNLLVKYLPNNGSLYHIFAYFLRDYPKKDDYFEILFEYQKPSNILNNYEFTFEDILKYDSRELYENHF